jgi:hypothetical protein
MFYQLDYLSTKKDRGELIARQINLLLTPSIRPLSIDRTDHTKLGKVRQVGYRLSKKFVNHRPSAHAHIQFPQPDSIVSHFGWRCQGLRLDHDRRVGDRDGWGRLDFKEPRALVFKRFFALLFCRPLSSDNPYRLFLITDYPTAMSKAL